MGLLERCRGPCSRALVIVLLFLVFEPGLSSTAGVASNSNDLSGADGAQVRWLCDLTDEEGMPDCASCLHRPAACLTMAARSKGNASAGYVGKCVDECDACADKSWSCVGTCVGSCNTDCKNADAPAQWHCPYSKTCVSNCSTDCPDHAHPTEDAVNKTMYKWEYPLVGQDWEYQCMSTQQFKDALRGKCASASNTFQKLLLQGFGAASILNLLLLSFFKYFVYKSPVTKHLIQDGVLYLSIVTTTLQAGSITLCRSYMMLAADHECKREEGWNWARPDGKMSGYVVLSRPVSSLAGVALGFITLQLALNYKTFRDEGSKESANAKRKLERGVSTNSIFRHVTCHKHKGDAHDNVESKKCGMDQDKWDWHALYQRGKSVKLIDEVIITSATRAFVSYYGNAWGCLFEVLYGAVVVFIPYILVMEGVDIKYGMELRNDPMKIFRIWQMSPIYISVLLVIIMVFVVYRTDVGYFWQLPEDVCAPDVCSDANDCKERCNRWRHCMEWCKTEQSDDPYFPGKCDPQETPTKWDEMIEEVKAKGAVNITRLRGLREHVILDTSDVFKRMATCWAVGYARKPLPWSDPGQKNSLLAMFTFQY